MCFRCQKVVGDLALLSAFILYNWKSSFSPALCEVWGCTCPSWSSCALQRFAEPQGCPLPGYRAALHLSPPASPVKAGDCGGGEVGEFSPVHLEAGPLSPPDAACKGFLFLCYHYYYLSLLLIGEKCNPAAQCRDLRAPAGWSASCHLENQPLCCLLNKHFISHACSEPPAVAHTTTADK